MYAIVEIAGQQFKVEKDQQIFVHRLQADEGSKVEFKEVLMVSDGESHKIGTPVLKGAVVKAEIMSNGRAKKVKIMKFKRRKHHMKQMGHRQSYSEIKRSGYKWQKNRFYQIKSRF